MKIASFDRFEFEIPEEAIKQCNHQGQCDKDVEYWQTKIDLSHVSDQKLREELRDYGAWNEKELKDRIQNERRIIWIAAGNIQDEETMRKDMEHYIYKKCDKEDQES